MSHSSDHSRNSKTLTLFQTPYLLQELQWRVREDHRPDRSHLGFAEDRGVWVSSRKETLKGSEMFCD